MCFSQENHVLLLYYFGKFWLNTCSYVTKSRISDPTASKIRFFVTLVNSSKPFTNITKSSILDVAGSKMCACYLIFYWFVLFCYLESENSGSYSHPHENWAWYFINCRNYKEECLPSKTVEDEDTILIDTNNTIDLGKIIANEVKRDTFTRDQIYRYFRHQKIPSENEDLFKKQVTQARKTCVLRFKHK